MLKDELYYLFKKNYISLKIMCEKWRWQPDADQKRIDANVAMLEASWKLIEEKYE